MTPRSQALVDWANVYDYTRYIPSENAPASEVCRLATEELGFEVDKKQMIAAFRLAALDPVPGQLVRYAPRGRSDLVLLCDHCLENLQQPIDSDESDCECDSPKQLQPSQLLRCPNGPIDRVDPCDRCGEGALLCECDDGPQS